MEGYDKALIGNFWAQPAFSQRYGVYVPSTNSYTVTAPWQVAIGQAATIGSFCGSPRFPLAMRRRLTVHVNSRPYRRWLAS